MTPLQSHVARWKEGCGNTICEGMRRVVFGRGKVPCDVLFIGEAPGVSEEALGQPFVGPAGKLLDSLIERSLESLEAPELIRIAFTNIVGCIPRNDEGKPTAPDISEAKRCASRLQEFIVLAKPKVLVLVGDQACIYSPKPVGVRSFFSILHPAAILRANVAQQGLMIQRVLINLVEAFEEAVRCRR